MFAVPNKVFCMDNGAAADTRSCDSRQQLSQSVSDGVTAAMRPSLISSLFALVPNFPKALTSVQICLYTIR